MLSPTHESTDTGKKAKELAKPLNKDLSLDEHGDTLEAINTFNEHVFIQEQGQEVLGVKSPNEFMAGHLEKRDEDSDRQITSMQDLYRLRKLYNKKIKADHLREESSIDVPDERKKRPSGGSSPSFKVTVPLPATN